MKRGMGNKIAVLFLTLMMITSSLTVVPVAATTPTTDATTGEIVIAATDYNTKEGAVEDKGTYLLFNPDGSVTYNFTIAEGGTYKLKTQHQQGDSTDTDFDMTVKIDDMEELNIKRRADYYKYIRGAYSFELSAGEHTLSIGVTSTSGGRKVKLHNIYLERMEATDISGVDETELPAVNYAYGNFRYWDENPSGTSNDQGVTWARGSLISTTSNPSLPGVSMFGTYYVKVEEDSYFDLSILSGSTEDSTVAIVCDEGTEKEVVLGNSLSVPSTGAYRKAAWKSLGMIRLTPGEHKLKITHKTGTFYFFALKVKLVGGKLKVDKVEYGDELTLSNGVTIPRGTDNFKLYFNLSIKESTLTNDNISLANSSGEEVKLTVVENSDKVAAIKLKEALGAGETYTLTLKDVAPEYGTALDEIKEYTFTADTTDSAVGSIECVESSEDYANMYIKLVTKSSIGEPIKGRWVTVIRTNPAGNETVTLLEETLSGENGIVEIRDTITGENYGNYKYTATCEGAQGAVDVILNYITKEYETEILRNLIDTTAETIGDFFSTYYVDLGIDPATEIPEGIDEEKVYGYFIGNEIENGSDFRDKYHTAIFTEIINHATDVDAIKGVLADAEAIDLFGIDKTLLDILFGYVTDAGANAEDPSDDIYAADELANEIYALDTISDLQLMGEALCDLVEQKFMEICGKADIALETKSFTSYIGKSVEIPIELETTATNVTDVEVSIWSEDLTFDKDKTSIEVPNSTSKWDGDVLRISLSYNRKADVTKIGSVLLKPENEAGSYTIKVKGKLYYDVNLDKNDDFNLEEDILVVGDIIEGSFPVTITEKANNSKDSAGVTTMVSREYPLPEAEKPTDTDVDGYTFSDIDGVDWAKESIEALLERAVISKSEDGKFNPNNNITRAEYLKMVMEALGMVNEEAIASFEDVSTDDWFYKYVASATEAGIVNGNELGQFRPNDSITREDMAVIVIRAMKAANIEIPEISEEKFADDDDISDYAKDAIYRLKNMGIINGVGDNMFMPLGNATRAETAKMVYEMIKAVAKL